MIIVKPSIEILSDTDYQTMLKKIERIGRSAIRARTTSRTAAPRPLSGGSSSGAMSLSSSTRASASGWSATGA